MKWLIPLAIVLVLVGAIWYGVYQIKRKVRGVSRTLFGTDDILKGIAENEEYINNTPKTVSGGDRLYLDSIMKDFPDFNLDLAKSYIEECITDYFSAMETQDITTVKEKYAGSVAKKAEAAVNDLISSNKHVGYDNLKFHKTVIYQYVKSGQDRVIKFQSAFEYTYTDEQGSKKIQDRMQVDYTYYLESKDGEDSVALRCKYCGAPVSNLGGEVCSYCGNAIVGVIDKVWKVTNISQI